MVTKPTSFPNLVVVKMVGPVRFDLTAFRAAFRRGTKLRYAPTQKRVLTLDTLVNRSLGIAPLRSAFQGTERTAPAAKPSPELPPAG